MTDEAYDRGRYEGGVAERLDSHDRHFAAINGSLASLLQALTDLTLAVQRLGDQADASAATTVATAAALAEAEDQRRRTSDRSWSPWARAFAVAGGLAALAGLVGCLVALISAWPDTP